MFRHKACIVPTNERHVLEWLHIATEWKLMTWNCHGASRLTPVKPQAWLVTGRAKPIYHWIMHHLIKSGVTQPATNAKSLRTWPPDSSHFPKLIFNPSVSDGPSEVKVWSLRTILNNFEVVRLCGFWSGLLENYCRGRANSCFCNSVKCESREKGAVLFCELLASQNCTSNYVSTWQQQVLILQSVIYKVIIKMYLI